jgi:hypothetical protein
MLFKAMLFRGCFAALGFASAMAVATPTTGDLTSVGVTRC